MLHDCIIVAKKSKIFPNFVPICTMYYTCWKMVKMSINATDKKVGLIKKLKKKNRSRLPVLAAVCCKV